MFILLKFYFLTFYLVMRERERERERERKGEIDLLFHLFMHSLGDSCFALTKDRTHNLYIWGQCSNQLPSHPARAVLNFVTVTIRVSFSQAFS